MKRPTDACCAKRLFWTCRETYRPALYTGDGGKQGIRQLSDLVGSQLSSFSTPTDLDRTTLIYPKIDRERCVGCGRCELSCRDGGHQAITFDKETRQPHIIGTKCVGCHLCRLVCPAGAIGMSKRIPKK